MRFAAVAADEIVQLVHGEHREADADRREIAAAALHRHHPARLAGQRIGQANFEPVLPPPKFVMRRSAPSRFDRYRRSSSGLASLRGRFARGPEIFQIRGQLLGQTTSGLQVAVKTSIVCIPAVGSNRLEAFDRERMFDDEPRFVERRHGLGGHHLHGNVAERARLHRPGYHVAGASAVN